MIYIILFSNDEIINDTNVIQFVGLREGGICAISLKAEGICGNKSIKNDFPEAEDEVSSLRRGGVKTFSKPLVPNPFPL